MRGLGLAVVYILVFRVKRIPDLEFKISFEAQGLKRAADGEVEKER